MRTLAQRMPVLLVMLMLTSLPHLLYVLAQWHDYPLHHGVPMGPTDPDSWLRLTLVRDWLSGGNWYSHVVAHTNAPLGGVSSPWTRPLDCVIAVLAWLQPESVELSLRIMRASLLLPWIWMTLLVAGIYRVVAITVPPRAAYLMASLLAISTPAIWNYFGLGNADHHAPLAVLFIWALVPLLQANPTRRAMVVSGMLLGLQLWVSVEALILIAAIYGWLGMQWLRGKPPHLAVLATSAAIASLLAVLAERPYDAWLTPVYDSISVVHVAALVAAALVAHALRCVGTRRRVAWAGICSTVAVVALHSIYPLLFAGPMVGVDPYIFSHFLPNISEAQPFYAAPTLLVLAGSMLPLVAIALCAAAWFAPAYAFYDREAAATRLYFLFVTLALYYAQMRWSYYLLPLAVAVVAPVLGALFNPAHAAMRGRWPATWLGHLPERAQAARRLPIALLLALVPFLLTTANASSTQLLTKQRSACYRVARELLASGQFDRLMGDTPVTIFAPTDLGAEIMFWSKHRIVASNYHREGAGIAYVWEANNITHADDLRHYLAQRNVQALLLCPTVKLVRGSILQGMSAGEKPPAWLTPIAYDVPKMRDGSAETVIANPVLLRVMHPDSHSHR